MKQPHLARAIELLKWASDVLSKHHTYSDGEDERNNDDVIEAEGAILVFLKEMENLELQERGLTNSAMLPPEGR